MPETPQTQAGFTDPLKLSALSLKSRILSGEAIPLSELKAFILSAEKDLGENRMKAAKIEKKQDVDFF